jgi:hypothetical protein
MPAFKAKSPGPRFRRLQKMIQIFIKLPRRAKPEIQPALLFKAQIARKIATGMS